MAETALAATPPIVLPLGRHGRKDGQSGVRICAISGRTLIHVAVRHGCEDEVAAIAQSRFGVALPQTPHAARGAKIEFLWSGYRQWLAMADEAVVPELGAVLRREFGSKASLTDHSDGRCTFALTGPRVRETLAKLAPIDLHPRAFSQPQTALTLFGHIGGQITQVDQSPIYELMAFRSFSGSLWRGICEAAEEVGIAVVPDRRQLVADAQARVE